MYYLAPTGLLQHKYYAQTLWDYQHPEIGDFEGFSKFFLSGWNKKSLGSLLLPKHNKN